MPACSSCGKRITWCKTINGKPIPVDPDPVPGGNLDIYYEGMEAHVVKPDPAVRRHVAHFTTCPNAAAHRKGKS